MNRQIPNKITLDVYNEVLDNVIRNVGDQWEKNGGDFNVLTNIAELWRYKTMKSCNIDSPEPQSQPLRRAKQKQQANNDELFKLLSGGFQQPKNDDKDSTESSSSSSSSSQNSGLDSGSDLGDSDSDKSSGSGKSSGNSSSDESSDGLSDVTDDEVNSMVTQIKARDRLFCEYTYESKKRKKGSNGFTLNVINGHFTIDGIPRVVKNGTITFS